MPLFSIFRLVSPIHYFCEEEKEVAHSILANIC